MPTFLLTYNPQKWDWPDYDKVVAATARGRIVRERWSVAGRRRGISPGDRAWLLRQGADRRGLVGSGTFTSEIYLDEHWDGSGGLTPYADVNWEILVSVDDRLPTEVLAQAVPGVRWGYILSSGQQAYPPSDTEIEALWTAHTGRGTFISPDEVPDGDYPEGAVQRVEVNRYERDPKARAACLAHHGYSCVACGFNFAEVYGAIGDSYIHVHHVREISTVGPKYRVNPKKDLVPVCPNCHSMLHSRRPALAVEDLQQILHSRAGA